MLTSMKKQSTAGFTVLELVLSLLIIGLIFATAMSRIDHAKRDTRNKEREGDTTAIQLAVEAYYAKNAGIYPKKADMANIEWVTTNLPGIDNAKLTDPNGVTINQPGGYQYTPTEDGTKPCEDANVKCAKYTISAAQEAKPQIDLKSFN